MREPMQHVGAVGRVIRPISRTAMHLWHTEWRDVEARLHMEAGRIAKRGQDCTSESHALIVLRPIRKRRDTGSLRLDQRCEDGLGDAIPDDDARNFDKNGDFYQNWVHTIASRGGHFLHV